LGQPILPIALDVSWRPQIEFGIASQKIFGKSYGAAICAWIDEMHSAPLTKEAKIILFTYPEIYSNYSLASAPCNLREIPVWISHHSQDGDLPANEKKPDKLKLISELCQGPKGDRCIIQQYTSFGGFGIFASEPSLDMDRFIGTTEELEQLQQTFESR
jgi:hypothetical protein